MEVAVDFAPKLIRTWRQGESEADWLVSDGEVRLVDSRGFKCFYEVAPHEAELFKSWAVATFDDTRLGLRCAGEYPRFWLEELSLKDWFKIAGHFFYWNNPDDVARFNVRFQRWLNGESVDEISAAIGPATPLKPPPALRTRIMEGIVNVLGFTTFGAMLLLPAAGMGLELWRHDLWSAFGFLLGTAFFWGWAYEIWRG